MKIVIASDSYKESLSNLKVSNAIESGIRKVLKDVEIVKVLVGDGGEGTLEAIVSALKGNYVDVEVLDPLGLPIIAKYGVIKNDSAIIEMAQASGLMLISDQKLKPLFATTYGTGQLINHALNEGYKKIYVGLGGSATTDGGVGMAMALGVKFYNKNNDLINNSELNLNDIHIIDISNVNPLIQDCEIIGLSDVMNPLFGENGAAYVFGKQKGASLNEIIILDNRLRHYNNKLKEFLNVDVSDFKGAGAAGGLGTGLMAFCKAKIEMGADKVLEIVNLENEIKSSDLVITGEGKIDGQTILGKTPIGVSKLAQKYNVFTLAIVGSVGKDAYKAYDYGIDMITSIIDRPMTIESAFENAEKLIEKATIKSITTILRIKKIKADKV